jgi:hypothetical protein
MKKFLKSVGTSKSAYLAVVASGLVGASMSAAAAVDTASIVSVITDAGAAGAVIGAAVLAMHYGLKLFKWIRQAG